MQFGSDRSRGGILRFLPGSFRMKLLMVSSICLLPMALPFIPVLVDSGQQKKYDQNGE